MLATLNILAVFAIVLGITTCTAVNKTAEQDIRKCRPNFCQIAKFKCISEDSCNGTLVPPTEPCQCCPSCITFQDKGEECENEEEIPKYTSTTPSTHTSKLPEKTTVAPSKEGKSIAGIKKCKSGLTCLQGTCVVIF